MLQDCVECMGVGANMARSDNIAEEGTRAVSTVAQGAAVAKELGDVRCVSATLGAKFLVKCNCVLPSCEISLQ